LFQRDVVFGLTFCDGIIRKHTCQLVLRSLKFHRWPADAGRQSNKLHFALSIGGSFQIKLVESAKAIGDVNFDLRVVDGFVVNRGYSELQLAGSGGAVDYWNFGRRLRVQLRLSRKDKDKEKARRGQKPQGTTKQVSSSRHELSLQRAEVMGECDP
jgi:hypothetical protein